MPEVSGRPGHLVDGAPPVGPVGVAVTISPKQLQELPDRAGRRGGSSFLEGQQVGGRRPGQRLTDHCGGALAHPGEGFEAALLVEAGQLGRRHFVHRRRRSPERLHLVGFSALRL